MKRPCRNTRFKGGGGTGHVCYLGDAWKSPGLPEEGTQGGGKDDHKTHKCNMYLKPCCQYVQDCDWESTIENMRNFGLPTAVSLLAISSAIADDSITFDAVPATAAGVTDIQLKAPSTFQNCDCQCDSYVVGNRRGQVAGNCKR